MTNDVFGMGLTFTQLIMSLLVLIVGTIAVKISFNFDINKYLKERQERYSAKCKNACVHFEFVPKGDSILVNSFFVSPPDTFNYICQRCGLIRIHLDQDSQQRTIDYYGENIKEYYKQNKRFHKLLKKSGNI
jgi:hypothetical protein